MKSGLLITGMIIAIAISATYVSFAYNQEIKLATGMMTSGETGPRHVPDPICFVIDRTTSGQTENAVILEKCYPLSDFVNMGCGYLMLEHLYNHSNLLDKEFDGEYSMEEIGLSDGVSVEKFNECVEFIFEKRISFEFDKTWGGPGNRHPAFLGWDIPDVCTNDMVKFLKKHSNIFDKDVPYMSPLEGDVLDPSINPDDMVQCENKILENRDNEPSWPENEN